MRMGLRCSLLHQCGIMYEMELTTQDTLELTAQDIADDFIEGMKTSREVMLISYYKLGMRLLEEERTYGERIVQRVAELVNRSERTAYYAMKFAHKFPEFPQGINTPWRDLIKEELTEPGEVKKLPDKVKKVCPNCGYEL